MGESKIIRKGGGGVVTKTPTISLVSKDDESITFTITNNDAATADVFWELGDSTPDANVLSLATGATSSNLTVSGLDGDTEYTIFTFANAENKAGSATASLTVTTDESFSPADLSPQLWLDASDATTITASSGSVSQWNNKGSLGNFTQATSANQPTTGVTTLNGLNVIDFDVDLLVAANTNEWKFLHDGTKYEVFSVAKIGTSSNPDALYFLLGNSFGSSSAIGAVIFYDDRSSVSRNDRIGHVVNRGVTGSIVVDNVSGNDYFLPNQFSILSVNADPSNATAANRSEIRLNNGTAEKNNTLTNAVSTSNPGSALAIGGGSGTETSFALVGSIAEIIIISGANVTSQNRTDVINYLADKWGITL